MFYIVSYQNCREPECYIGGLYDDEQHALQRLHTLEQEYDYVWYEEVQLGDLQLSNR